MATTMERDARLAVLVPYLLLAAVALLVLAGPALAGTDTTFDTAFQKFSGFLEGSGGKIITLISLAGGLVGLASGRFSLAQIAIPVGVGVGVGTGIPIVTSVITAVI
ncbi:MAG TPA: TrbC/VirB2 family protein [Sphingobium sp.]|uniref:TrbC/VirB2 family protein n=1 Tax=Sphingobium sp. TaxID=1912891 RepID=UPI002ED2060E